MEYRHFTHIHGLDFHQLQPGSEIQCSACKTSAAGRVYVCWRCHYFLHERCYNAPRSLKTSIHPLHPLTLVPYPTHQYSSFYCNSCNLLGNGLSYCCAACNFDLHIHCADFSGNPAPIPPSPGVYPVTSSGYHFPSNPGLNQAAPIGIPGYPALSAPQMPLPSAPYHYSDPLPPCPPISHPPPPPPQPGQPPNPTLPIYTPPVSSIGVTAPPQPPQPAVSLTTNTAPASTVSSGSSPSPPPVSQSSSNQPKPPALIKHFSHPHVLLQMEIDKKNAKVCSACECSLSGSAYCCTEGSCTFNLHKACFESPMEVRHKCHLDHPLKLLTAPPYNDGFTCNACLKEGKAFAYHCAECSYDLHIDCITWPETVTRPDHKHALNLYYSSPAGSSNPDVVFACDVCKNPVHDMAWLYYCRDCDYGTHLECVAAGLLPAADAGQAEEDLLMETQLKFAVLQLLLSGGLNAAK